MTCFIVLARFSWSFPNGNFWYQDFILGKNFSNNFDSVLLFFRTSFTNVSLYCFVRVCETFMGKKVVVVNSSLSDFHDV